MRICRLSESIAAVAVVLFLSGCPRKAIQSWLQCTECSQEELDAVLRLDQTAVSPLRRALLEGLPPGRRLGLRVQLAREYRSLQRYLSEEHKKPIAMREQDFVDLHLLRADEYHRIQAARALAKIGGDEARKALVDASRLAPPPSDSVVRAIGEALKEISSGAGSPVDGFVGIWSNIDTKTESWTRLELRTDTEKLYVRIWRACQPSECDDGEWPASLSDAYDGVILLKSDRAGAIRYLTLRLVADGRMQVRTQTHYADGSSRPDEDRKDTLVRRLKPSAQEK